MQVILGRSGRPLSSVEIVWRNYALDVTPRSRNTIALRRLGPMRTSYLRPGVFPSK